MQRITRALTHTKRHPSDALENNDNKRARFGVDNEELEGSETNTKATVATSIATKKRSEKQRKDLSNVNRLTEETEGGRVMPVQDTGLRLTSTAKVSSVEAQPEVSNDVLPRSIFYDDPEEAVVTEDEDRGGTIETAIFIDDDGDEDDDNDAPEELASHLSQDPDHCTASAQRYASKESATVGRTPEGFKTIKNLGNNRLITGFKRFKKSDSPRVIESDSLELLTAEELAQKTANFLQPLWESNTSAYKPMFNPPTDHDLVPIDLDDPTALQVPAFILRKPSPRLYKNLGLNEDGTKKPGFPRTRAANEATPAEVEAEDSADDDVEVVEETPKAPAGSEGYEEEVDTETRSRNHAQLGTSTVGQDIHLRDALLLSTNTRAQRSIETGTFESGGTASFEVESFVNGINEKPMPPSMLVSPASAVIDEVGFNRSAQRIKSRRYRGLSTTQIPFAGTPSLWNTSVGNASVPIGARAIHPHAELVLSLTEEINRLEEEKANLATAKEASSAYSNKLYLENVALRKLLKQNAPHVQLTAELATINVTSAAPSTTASRQQFQQHADAGPASSSIIDLSHEPASIDHNNILKILGAADWLDNQEEKLRQDNKNNSFGRPTQSSSDDERRPARMAIDGRQDLPRYMMDRIWTACNDAEKAETAIVSLLKLDSFVEQERFLSELDVKEAENDSGANTEAAASKEPHEPSPRRPSVSPFSDDIHINEEDVSNALQKQAEEQTSATRTKHNQPSFKNLFSPFSSALAAMKENAPSTRTGVSGA